MSTIDSTVLGDFKSRAEDRAAVTLIDALPMDDKKLLIEAGFSSSNTINDVVNGITPLIFMSYKGRANSVRNLLKYPDIKLDYVTPEGVDHRLKGHTALSYIVHYNTADAEGEPYNTWRECVRIMLEKDPSAVDFAHPTGMYIGGSILMDAVGAGDLKVIAMLIQMGAPLDYQMPKDGLQPGGTALHIAVQTRKLGATRLLVESGANRFLKEGGGSTPVDVAKNGRDEIEKYFGSLTALIDAVKEKDLKKVRALLSNGVQDIYGDEYGRNALYWAVDQVNSVSRRDDVHTNAVVEILLNSAVDAFEIDSQERRASSSLDTVAKTSKRVFTKPRPRIDLQNRAGETALHRAARRNHRIIAQRLISASIITGAKIDVRNNQGSTALHLAGLQDHSTMIEILVRAFLKTGATLDYQDDYGRSALHYVVTNKANHKMTNSLLGHGACFDLKDRGGESPRQLLFDHSHGELGSQATLVLLETIEDLFEIAEKDTKKLLEQILTISGPAINARSKQRNGNTALHVAIQNQRLEVVLGLLMAKANIDLKNDDGKTARDLIMESSNPSIQALGKLLQIKAKIAASFDAAERPVALDGKEPSASPTAVPIKQTTRTIFAKDPNALTTISFETLQPLVDSITAVLPTIQLPKLKSYICFELGMLLARRKSEVHYEGLAPIDAVQAYNLLAQVSAEDPTKYAQAQTLLDILCFERHVWLEKGPDYPQGPFVAVSAEQNIEAQDDILERAMFYHRARSGAENPHKDTTNKLAGDLIDPGMSIQGIPGFANFSDIASINRFFDAAEETQRQTKARKQSIQDMGKQIAELELIFQGPKVAGFPVSPSLVVSKSVHGRRQ